MIEVNDGGLWGQHISLMDPKDWLSGRVFGHWSPQPKDGAAVFLRMNGAVCSGKLNITKRCTDPPDMFFGTIRWDSWRLRLEQRKLKWRKKLRRKQ